MIPLPRRSAHATTFALGALLLLGVAGPRRTLAQPSGPPRDTAKEAARRFTGCKLLYRKEHFQQAAECFLAVHQLLPRRNTLLNAAIAYGELGDPLRASRYLVSAEKIAGEPADQILDPREYAKLLRLRRQVARLVIVPRNERDVVTVNGTPHQGKELDEIYAPGTYLVVVTSPDGTRVQRRLELVAGGESRWVLHAGTGQETAPRRPSPDDDRERSRPRRHRAIGRLPFGYFLGVSALTLACTVALAVTGAHTQVLRERYLAHGDLAIRDEGIRYRTATNGLIGAAVVSGVAAVTLAVFTRWRKPARARDRGITAIAPWLGPEGGGVTVGGAF
jgi:hypothetical protein